MKIWFYIISLFLSIAPFTMQAGNNIMFDKANQLYHNKNYDSAAKLYQQMIQDGYCAADLFYNAGNAYYRLNKIGMAIWCYEKAILIHKDKNYNDNLSLANQRIKEPIETLREIFFIRWWQSLYQILTVNKWAILSLALFLLALIPLFIMRLKPGFYFSKTVIRALFGLSAFCVFMMLVAAYNQTFHYRAVIIEPKTLLTNLKQKESIYLNEGIVVKLVKTEGESVIVKLPDGREGKLNRKALKKI
ncbi:MAG: hypothetical protein IPI46_12655 [Bacteroidetes bacterium]|nr:hypothetical protein [Bacteroidota bacterium]